MTLQEIIESGLIELYAMNVLSIEESAQVEAWAAQYPEVQAEIDETHAVLEQYAQAQGIEPSPELKAKILGNIEREIQENTPKNQDITQPVSKSDPLSNAAEISDKSLNFNKMLPWIVAGISLILGGFAFFNAKNTESELINCKKDNIQLVDKQRVIVDLQQKMNILRSDKTRTVLLKGLPIAPDAKVFVYWNKEEKSTYLSISNLPAPPTKKQYQLWAIVDGKPVDAGVINYDLADVQAMKIFDKAAAFAITLENEGGSISPTMDKMYVIGTL